MAFTIRPARARFDRAGCRYLYAVERNTGSGVVVERRNRESALFNNMMNVWFEAARFGADSQRVMALRLMRIASGGPLAATEARRMVAEKVAAFGESQGALMTALATGRSMDAAAALAYAPYRRAVRANNRRLGS